jgi:3-carboxy-cis,cis-muconate cycloisomerase
VLQLKDALGLIERELERLIASLAGQARVYKDTPMAGRTHGQHAVPVTLGYKLAVVMAELCRHRERLAEMRPRVLVGQLAGAAGTLASLGEQAAPVRQAMLDDLGLGVPQIAWHTARDGIAETVGVLAMIAATCGKFANEVVNLQRTEIAELAEPAGRARSGPRPCRKSAIRWRRKGWSRWPGWCARCRRWRSTPWATSTSATCPPGRWNGRSSPRPSS